MESSIQIKFLETVYIKRTSVITGDIFDSRNHETCSQSSVRVLYFYVQGFTGNNQSFNPNPKANPKHNSRPLYSYSGFIPE